MERDPKVDAEKTVQTGNGFQSSTDLDSSELKINTLLTGCPENESNPVILTPGIKKYVQGLISEDKLNEKEILQLFNVDEIKFKNVLKPVCKNILELFYFINQGKLLEMPRDCVKLNQVLKTEGVEEIWHKDDLTLPAILKLLVVLMESLHGNKFFFTQKCKNCLIFLTITNVFL